MKKDMYCVLAIVLTAWVLPCRADQIVRLVGILSPVEGCVQYKISKTRNFVTCGETAGLFIEKMRKGRFHAYDMATSAGGFGYCDDKKRLSNDDVDECSEHLPATHGLIGVPGVSAVYELLPKLRVSIGTDKSFRLIDSRSGREEIIDGTAPQGGGDTGQKAPVNQPKSLSNECAISIRALDGVAEMMAGAMDFNEDAARKGKKKACNAMSLLLEKKR